MLKQIYRMYWQVEKSLAPGLRYSQDVYEQVLSALVGPETRWLDVGCGHRVLSEWRFDAERELVARASYVAGLDADASALTKHRTIKNTWTGNADQMPFPDEAFNLVTANMVLEHLEDPTRTLSEIRRVLSPGGLFVFHTLNSGGYLVRANRHLPDQMKRLAAKLLDGRNSNDVYPTFYRCNSTQTIVPAARSNGLDVKEIRFIPSTAIFARVLPVAALELVWIRATMRESLAHFRTNIIGILCNPA